MKQLPFGLLASFLLVAFPTTTPVQTADSQDFADVLRRLVDLSPDSTRVAEVSDLTFTRDAAKFVLHEGELHLTVPVAGRTVAAVFLGRGSFTMVPPTQVERGQARRFFDSTTVAREFEALVMFFADSTLREFESQVSFRADLRTRNPKGTLADAVQYLTDGDGKYFDADLMTAVLNGHHNELFYAYVDLDRGDPLLFQISPYDQEEITLLRRAGRRTMEIVCSFHRRGDYAYRDPDRRQTPDLVRLDNYGIESTIAENLDYSATAEVDVTANESGLSWVPIALYSKMEVDSAVWADGSAAVLHKSEDQPVMWLELPEMQAGDTQRLSLGYHGDLLDWREPFAVYRGIEDRGRNRLIEMQTTYAWFPRAGLSPVSLSLTYHTPAKWAFVSVGEKIFEETSGDVLTTQWVTPQIMWAGFNLGEFEEHVLTDERIPPVTLQVAAQLHRNTELVTESGRQVIFLQQDDIGRQVGADLANSMYFFQSVFGPAPVERFYATEIAGMHGQAFPGLVHLSWITFQWTDEKGSDETFRSHEVAHQWWGIAVDPLSYRDAWISEGFASFSGLWYLQTILNDNQRYFEILKDWREAIIDQHEKADAGPIWLGSRVVTNDHPENYSLIVYRKGAWVMHMLRNLLIEFETMNEDRFKAMMQDFYRRYVGRRATTADFAEVVEEHVGEPMDWFFDQWVYGTDIPKYRFAYRVDETTDGTYLARIRVEQENVPDSFRMYVPLLLDFGENGSAWLRVPVQGPVTEGDLPTLPMRPERIVFNPLESVLAVVDNVGWD